MSWSQRCQRMSATLVEQFIELKPKHTAKWFARLLGVSVRTGKRYATHPELFPESRAVELLVAIEREERRLEARREERRMAREAVRREIEAALGVDGPGVDLLAGRDRGGPDLGAPGRMGASLPDAGGETP